MLEKTGPYSNTHVLIVDDLKLTPMVVAKTLRRLGCRLDSAHNGTEALQKMAQRKFDLVFMDCYMPEMDGFETTRTIRASDPEKMGNPVIIALTGNTMNIDREKCLKAGMNDFLSKPFSPEQISAIAHKWLKQ